MRKKLTWKTTKRKVNDLIPYSKNPRRLTDKQKADLQKSLEKFNLVEIPAINTDNKIIAGHQRIKILQLLGRGDEIIDVRIPDRKLNEKEYKEYLIRSNKNTGEFDFELLADFNKDLLKDIGFDDITISIIFQIEDVLKEKEIDINKISEGCKCPKCGYEW